MPTDEEDDTPAIIPPKPSDAEALRGDPQSNESYRQSLATVNDLNREKLRAQKFQNENAGQRNPTSLRTIEARERSRQQRDAQASAKAQEREDFWNQGKANERPEVKAAREAKQADFQQRQDSQRDRMDAALKPLREAAFARQAAEKQRQEQMQNPARRMAQARLDNAGKGMLNYAEFSGPDGKKATYMRPTKEGTEGYLATRGNKNLKDMASKAQSRASAMPSLGMPQSMTAPASQVGTDRVTNAMAVATPKPATPNMVMPTFNPAQPAAQPSLMAGTPARPDPNATAAIASFNQSVANLPGTSSPDQNANLRNLQRGNIPTLANVPGMMADKAVGSVSSFVREGMEQRPNRVRGAISAAGDIISGKTPLISPRRRTQTAQTQPKNPLLARR